MLWTIFVILLVLWLFGLVSAYTLGGFIHLLLIIAVSAKKPGTTSTARRRGTNPVCILSS